MGGSCIKSSTLETSAAMNSRGNVEFLRTTEVRPRSLPETPEPFTEEEQQQQQQQLDGTPISSLTRPRSVSVESMDEQYSYLEVLAASSEDPQVERQPTNFGGLKEAINNAGADDLKRILSTMVDTLENGLRPNEHTHYNRPGNATGTAFFSDYFLCVYDSRFQCINVLLYRCTSTTVDFTAEMELNLCPVHVNCG